MNEVVRAVAVVLYVVLCVASLTLWVMDHLVRLRRSLLGGRSSYEVDSFREFARHPRAPERPRRPRTVDPVKDGYEAKVVGFLRASASKVSAGVSQ